MHPWAVLQILILLLVANGTPVILKRIWGDRFSYPLDGGLKLWDGRRLLGQSKTIRGVLSSIVVTSACAPVIGLEWPIGAIVGSASMIGDLLSSFLKRRLRLAPSSRATGLDQIPESLLPFLACYSKFALTVADIVVGVMLFFIGEIILSRLLYKFRVRNHPY